jgi:hypothetical protein
MSQQKTYWHLLQQKRMPTEYEIVTSKLLCYTGEGFTGKRFELDVPLKDGTADIRKNPYWCAARGKSFATHEKQPTRSIRICRERKRSSWTGT